MLGTICMYGWKTANMKQELPRQQLQYGEPDVAMFYCFHPLDGESLLITAPQKSLQVLKFKEQTSRISFMVFI